MMLGLFGFGKKQKEKHLPEGVLTKLELKPPSLGSAAHSRVLAPEDFVRRGAGDPLPYIVGGMLTRFSKECRKYKAHSYSCRSLSFFLLMVLALGVFLAFVELQLQRITNIDEVVLKAMVFAVLVAMSFPLVAWANRMHYDTEVFQNDKAAFQNNMNEVLGELKTSLEPLGYRLVLEEQEGTSKDGKMVLSLSQEGDNASLPAVIEDSPAVQQRYLLLTSTTLDESSAASIDIWTLGGLCLKLQKAQMKASCCTQYLLDWLIKPFLICWCLALIIWLPYTKEFSTAIIIYVAGLAVLCLLFFLHRCAKECFDMKRVHRVGAEVVNEVSRTVCEPRHGHRMIYEIERSKFLPLLFTQGRVRFEAVGENPSVEPTRMTDIV